MSINDSNLTGVWDGLYSYPARIGHPESPFTAVLFDGGGALSGTIHETMKFRRGVAILANAQVAGRTDGSHVSFTKSYDGTNGQAHSVAYSGTLSPDAGEIDGTWIIQNGAGVYAGLFLMIRGGRAAKVSHERAEERA